MAQSILHIIRHFLTDTISIIIASALMLLIGYSGLKPFYEKVLKGANIWILRVLAALTAALLTAWYAVTLIEAKQAIIEAANTKSAHAAENRAKAQKPDANIKRNRQ
jgi:hypothetical protein